MHKVLVNRLGVLSLPRKSVVSLTDRTDITLDIIESIHNTCLALENFETSCQIFCDISKAFDRVWHRGLLLKMERYGIRGDLLLWFKSYLENRTQKCALRAAWNGREKCTG